MVRRAIELVRQSSVRGGRRGRGSDGEHGDVGVAGCALSDAPKQAVAVSARLAGIQAHGAELRSELSFHLIWVIDKLRCCSGEADGRTACQHRHKGHRNDLTLVSITHPTSAAAGGGALAWHRCIVKRGPDRVSRSAQRRQCKESRTEVRIGFCDGTASLGTRSQLASSTTP